MSSDNQNGCLTVGEGVTPKGNFVVPDIASISGTIEGDLTAREILIGPTGVLKGNIVAEIIDIRGEAYENISAKKSLFIRSSGKVTGNVEFSEIEVEKGGNLQGTLTKINGSSSN